MTGAPSRRPARLGLAALAGSLVLLTGCMPPPADPGSPPSATGTASAEPAEPDLLLHPGTSDLEQTVAHVLARHLTHRGVPTEVADPSGQPWTTASGEGAAVVDTLRMAAQTQPEELTGPVPSPTAAPSPSEGEEPEASASPETTDTATAEASPTESPSPDPVPAGEAAPDAGAVDALVREQLPEQTEIVGHSSATLRLQAVTTENISTLLELDEITDLNGRCGELALAPQRWGELEAERLEVLAGCTPEALVDTGEREPALALVADEAQLALLYGTDPAITHHGLVPLEDPDRILPEGRLAVVADPDGLPDGVRGAVGEVLQRLDGTQLSELQQLLEGPDPLTTQQAAQYWLAQNGLETPPDGWF